jgi:hypothetical protein
MVSETFHLVLEAQFLEFQSRQRFGVGSRSLVLVGDPRLQEGVALSQGLEMRLQAHDASIASVSHAGLPAGDAHGSKAVTPNGNAATGFRARRFPFKEPRAGARASA